MDPEEVLRINQAWIDFWRANGFPRLELRCTGSRGDTVVDNELLALRHYDRDQPKKYTYTVAQAE